MTVRRWSLLLGSACGGCSGAGETSDSALECATPSEPKGTSDVWASWDERTSGCVGSPAPPACEPVHLGPPAVEGSDPCATAKDCAEDEFCGQGYCRSVDEPVTVCLNAVDFFGAPRSADGTPPDLQAHLVALDPLATSDVVVDDCRPVFDICTRVAINTPDPVGAVVYEVLDGSTATAQILRGESLVGSFEGWGFDRVTFARDHVDLGCVQPPPERSALTRDVVLWVSFWYP